MKIRDAEKEYLLCIQEFREGLNKGNVKEVDRMLETLFEIKPVRALWYVTKAEVMLLNGSKVDEIYKLLDGKFNTLYNYDNLEDIIQLYIRLAKIAEDEDEKKHWMYVWGNVCENPPEECRQLVTEINDRIKVLAETFLSGDYSACILSELINLCYVRQDYVMQYLLDLLFRKLYGGDTQLRECVRKKKNMGYLDLETDGSGAGTFIVLSENDADMLMSSVASNILGMLHQTVFFLDTPLMVEVEKEIDLKDTLKISMGNAEESGNYTVIHPVAISYHGEVMGDNRDYIVEYLCRTACPTKHATILCSGFLMDDLCQRDVIRKQTGRLFDFVDEFTEDKLTFGWTGDYLSYIGKIYCMDVRAGIERKAECDFSIVVPVRNNAHTLRPMLETCLNQTYQGSFEVVLSDNSTEGNNEIEKLYEEIKDPRVVYVKTPRDLYLTKSFEYAMLHTRGEYIIPIGADDGVFPWALTVLADIGKQYPDEEIIQWERGFYAWPGFNGRQEHQLIIPQEYTKGNYGISYVGMAEYLKRAMVEPSQIYILPLLYINSCFKREYLKTLLEKTGRMWDGACQDIYMGVITAYIQNRILNIRYPLTIAGMSSYSIGASTVLFKADIQEYTRKEQERAATDNIGSYCRSYPERYLPEVGHDAYALYGAILRGISIGVIPEEMMTDVLDWKKIFTLYRELTVERLLGYDRIAHEMRYDAAKWGSEFLEWFDKEIFSEMMTPKQMVERKQQGKGPGYVTGKRENGSTVLDASEYGVKDIAGAVNLFAKLTEL